MTGSRFIIALALGLAGGMASAQPMDTVASIRTMPAVVVSKAPASGVASESYLPGTYARSAKVERVQYYAPAPVTATVAAKQTEDGRFLCPKKLPVLREVTLRDGNVALRCAALSGARAAGIKGSQPMVPPPGYRTTWQDGRLNPLRGVRTEAGDREMARYWTKGVPMKGKPSATEPPPLLR